MFLGLSNPMQLVKSVIRNGVHPNLWTLSCPRPPPPEVSLSLPIDPAPLVPCTAVPLIKMSLPDALPMPVASIIHTYTLFNLEFKVAIDKLVSSSYKYDIKTTKARDYNILNFKLLKRVIL